MQPQDNRALTLIWLAMKLVVALIVMVSALLGFYFKRQANPRAYQIDLAVMYAGLALMMLTLDVWWLAFRIILAAFLAFIAVAIGSGKLMLRK